MELPSTTGLIGVLKAPPGGVRVFLNSLTWL